MKIERVRVYYFKFLHRFETNLRGKIMKNYENKYEICRDFESDQCVTSQSIALLLHV